MPDSSQSELTSNLQSEQALARLAAIINSSEDAIFSISLDGVIVDWNPAAARLFGYSGAEAVGRSLGMLFPPSHLYEFLALMDNVLLGNIIEHHDTVRLRQDGSTVPVSITVSPIRDEQGALLGASTIARDITERKDTEYELAASQARYHDQAALLDLSTDAIFTRNTQDVITYWNHGAAALYGWSASEAVGQISHILLQTQHPAPVEQFRSTLLAEGHWNGQLTHRTRAGVGVIVLSRQVVQYAENGAPVSILETNTDITDRERNANLLNSIVREATDGIFVKDLDGRYLLINAAGASFLGLDQAQVIGKLDSDLIPPNAVASIRAGDRAVVSGGEAQTSETIFERPDGTFMYQTVKVPYRDAHNKVIGIIGIARDITERRRAEVVTRFLGDASHLLASSMDDETLLNRLAELAVPQFADWCAIHIVRPDGSLEQLVLAHKDPSRRQLVYELQQRYTPRDDSPTGVRHVIRTGEPEVMTNIPDELIVAAARSASDLETIRQVGLKSYMIVPLLAQGRTLGAITFASTESNRRFNADDLAFAQILASRVAGALDNVRLYQQTQMLNQDLEMRVVERTIELIGANERLESEIAERRHAQVELQNSYTQLRELASRLQTVREEERAHIARELHDVLGQALTALKFDLAALTNRLPKRSAALRAQTQSMSEEIDAIIKTVRQLSTELRPGLLDDLGLAAAIEWQAQEFTARTGLECNVHVADGDLNITRAQATAIFRIFQETLTNVARHAGAARVDVELEQQDESITLQVRDNGNGFDPNGSAGSLGLLGMRERAEMLGGTFHVKSAVGQGTTVTLILPRTSTPEV